MAIPTPCICVAVAQEGAHDSPVYSSLSLASPPICMRPIAPLFLVWLDATPCTHCLFSKTTRLGSDGFVQAFVDLPKHFLHADFMHTGT
jgi:hypothetical protein